MRIVFMGTPDFARTILEISEGAECADVEYTCGVPAEISGFEAVKSFYTDLLADSFKREAAAKM